MDVSNTTNGSGYGTIVLNDKQVREERERESGGMIEDEVGEEIFGEEGDKMGICIYYSILIQYDCHKAWFTLRQRLLSSQFI